MFQKASFPDGRRVSYDHEPAYRQIAIQGGRGWDDRTPQKADSYEAFKEFIGSEFAPALDARRSAIDLGCGGGQLTILLAQRGYSTIGVDYSETAIELAKQNVLESGVTAELLVQDCVTLDAIPDSSQDLVVDNHVLHCIVFDLDRAAFLATIARILKPGGILFSETMTSEGTFNASGVAADPATGIALNWTRIWVKRATLELEFCQAGLTTVYQAMRTQTTLPDAGPLLVTYAKRN